METLMNSARDTVGLAEGQALLAQLPNLFSTAIESAQLERQVANEVQCSFVVPALGRQSRTAPTAREAIHAFLIELCDALTEMPIEDQPALRRERTLTAACSMKSTTASNGKKAARFQSKARQFTIGATIPVSLKASLLSTAENQSVSFADIARKLVALGFDDFDHRSFSEGSAELLAEFVSKIGEWHPSDTEQIMLRVDPSLAVRIRATAKEYRRSASQFGAMCLAHGHSLQAQRVHLEQKVAAFRGAPIRQLAPKVGLGNHSSLLSGILAGTIRAPKKVLRALSELFGVTEPNLTDFLKFSFESRSIAAFKTEGGKPQVARSEVSWEDAVRSLKLSSVQAEELLQLDQ